MDRLRVLLLSTDLQRGGLPLRLARLASRFHEVGVEPTVGCLAPRGPLGDVLDSAGILNFACGAAGRFDVRCLRILAAKIRKLDPDIVHASLFHANLAARLVGRLDRNRPIITSTVTIEIERPSHRLLESMTAGLSDLHVANSFAVETHLREELGFDAARLTVIPNAVDFDGLAAILPVDRGESGLSDAPLIVWAGRMDPVKNLEMVVNVVALLAARMPVQAVLLGDGPERQRIERFVDQRALRGSIRLVGWSDNVTGWLKAADLLLFPSFTEGSPNVLLEALAVGCPVVAGDNPACAELIRRAGAGILCHPYDTTSFVESCLQLIDVRAAARQAARRGASNLRTLHDTASVLRKWRAAYDSFAGSAATHRHTQPNM
ncbi:MAG TPA: glycosyltransferase [Phycisphaerae bacterium]|nr:glycosyltransferase [Phycisphaerae bacterium]